MTKGNEPTALEMLAENLKVLRSRAGLSVRGLADKLGWDHAHLHKMENAKSRGSQALIEALDTYYGTEHLKQLWTLARQTPFVDQYDRYLQLEAKAALKYEYAPSIVPGLLQTNAYARALLQASGLFGDGLDDQVDLRLERQRRVLSDVDPVAYRAIIDEAALMRCPLPDREEWLNQLAHLVEVAQRPNVTIQVLSRDAGLHGLTNTHTMFLRLPNGRSVAYAETGYSGELVEDPGEITRLQVLYDRMRDLALSPSDSLAFIAKLMEDMRCDPPDPT